ncbi:SPOR domain-containing protein [Sphingomonas sp. CBMAI 2297]|uniref:SPOR domain-containing protein n=1 Tax=Sphingomonas sp. CBMAI 2297 TaxID=2991720 RepID=UPI002457C6E6|nr:SPOR domain-containing protein [Sphingomonas sp. CBMAI 2297]MDH4744432.1 SPOR domain-containing protein [Sphingomonas sp. CBMAI 2297]
MNMRGGEAGFGDDDRLPWLETVEDDYREGPSFGRLLLLVVLLLAVLGAGAFGYYWYQKQKSLSGNGELIAAPEGDYKVKPDEPGGMKVDGEGDTVFATSQGDSGNSSIDTSALPEAPVDGKKVAEKAPSLTGEKNAKVAIPSSAAAAEAQPRRVPVIAPQAGGSGALIQLGAFPDEGGANAAWARLSKRFSYLAPLGKSVERGEKDGKSVFRLRVNAGSNGQARELCGKLKVAGESCYVAN